MKENMKEEINFFEKKFKFKSTFSKNENLLSSEFKINFLNNKNKILDTYSEISVVVEDVKKDKKVKPSIKKKVRKNFKRKKVQKK
jgi:ribonuclease E